MTSVPATGKAGTAGDDDDDCDDDNADDDDDDDADADADNGDNDVPRKVASTRLHRRTCCWPPALSAKRFTSVGPTASPPH
jgi:hypothetical protein